MGRYEDPVFGELPPYGCSGNVRQARLVVVPPMYGVHDSDGNDAAHGVKSLDLPSFVVVYVAVELL